MIFVEPIPVFVLYVHKNDSRCSQDGCFQVLSQGIWRRVIRTRKYVLLLLQVFAGTLLSLSSDVEPQCGISVLLGFGVELLFELVVKETVVSAALRTEHLSRMWNIFHVLLAHKHTVNEVPLFRPRIQQCWFQALFLLEDSIGNGELIFIA